MNLGLTLFGAPTIQYGDGPHALSFERRTQLLVFLALKRVWVGRAELAAMLWPEQQDKLAYANLRKALFRLQSFPWAKRIEASGNALRFDVATDVAAFEAALREQRLADAQALRGGDLLVGFDDHQNDAWSNWLGFERDRLRVAWRSAVEQHLAGDCDPRVAIDLAARLLEDDALDEAALSAYLTWLARTGQGARARQAYRDFAERLLQELGLTPSAELKALHDSIGAAALGSAATVGAQPFVAEDGFVGRAVELRRIAELITQDDCRLLTVTGPGGVGKTRLARRAMAELATRFADGAVFTPLEDIASPRELGSRLARELGITLKGSGEPLDQVLVFLRERHTLLVLDNFEQIVDASPALERMLSDCPGVKIVVTSRMRLNLASEWLMPLDGLPCPEKEDQDLLESFDAARLFVRAAQRVEPALVPAVEAAAIVEICRQVEGLPLALELAAAWTRVLSCEAIANELRAGTEVLQAVDAAQPSRHASFEVVFDQSWRLLTDIEREVLARLSVFRGSFAPEAARAVARAPLPVLGALADKSLLHKERARLHLHPLVQQLAAARLGAGTERETTERAHAQYFHRLLAQLQTGAHEGDRAALAAIDEELENCRLAWTWSFAHGHGDLLTRSASTLCDFFDYRGRPAEGLALFRAAMESHCGQSDARLKALLLSKASLLEYRLDRYAEAEAAATSALEAARNTRDSLTRVQAFTVLANCSLQRGRLADARRLYKQALALAPPDARAYKAAATLDSLALVERRMGNYGEALRLSIESLSQYRRLGDSAGEARCLNNLGVLYLATRDFAAAGPHLRNGLVICEREGIVSTQVYILANLSEVAMNTGDLDAAESYASRALGFADSTGNRVLWSAMKLQIARLAVRRGALDIARSALAAGLGVAMAIGQPTLKAGAVLCFGEILEAQGEVSCARLVLEFAAEHPATDKPERDEIRIRLDRMGATESTKLAWPGIELDALLDRIVVEEKLAHAPLIASLQRAS